MDDLRRELLLSRPLIENNRVTFPMRLGEPGTVTWFLLISTQEFVYPDGVDEVELGQHVIELWKMRRVVGSYYNKVLSKITTVLV